MLFLAEGKAFDRLFRILFHSFAKSSVVVCQIEELVDLVDTHLSLLQFPYGVAGAVVVFQKQGPRFSDRAGEGDPVKKLAAVIAGFVDPLFCRTTGQRLVFALNQQPGDRFLPLLVGPSSERPADVHSKTSAGDERYSLLTVPSLDKTSHHAAQRKTTGRQRQR